MIEDPTKIGDQEQVHWEKNVAVNSRPLGFLLGPNAKVELVN